MSVPLKPIEIAPIVSTFDGGAVFKGYGNSHFTFDRDGCHVTTEIPGFEKFVGCPVKDRFNIYP